MDWTNTLKEIDMNVKDEEEKEEFKQNESGLIDLPVADEQTDSTKGGGPANFAGTWVLDKSKTQ